MITIISFAAGALFAAVMLAVVEAQMRRWNRQQHEASEALRKARKAAVGALLLTLMSCSESPTQPEQCEFYTMRGATESQPCGDDAEVMTRLESHDGAMRFECVRRDIFVKDCRLTSVEGDNKVAP